MFIGKLYNVCNIIENNLIIFKDVYLCIVINVELVLNILVILKDKIIYNSMIWFFSYIKV